MFWGGKGGSAPLEDLPQELFNEEPTELLPEELATGDEMPVIKMEITDVLDLHPFPPRDIKPLVKDYLDLAYDKGLRQLRIVHGKGVGVQKRMVRSILDKDPRVVSYGDPPGESGGWGATWVTLR